MSLKQCTDLTVRQETPFIIFNDMACGVFSAIYFLAENFFFTLTGICPRCAGRWGEHSRQYI